MADAVIVLTSDTANTGKSIDCASLTVNALTVYRQRMILGDNVNATQYAKVDANGSLQTAAGPAGTSVVAAANVAAAANNQTLAGVANKTTYLAGFCVSGLGATGASGITITTTGLAGAQLNFVLPIPAGTTAAVTPLFVFFDPPLPASAQNTAIVLNVPSFGAGNTTASASAWGFQL